MSTVTTPHAVIRADMDGERRWFAGGGMHTWKVHSEETGGAFMLFEHRMEQGKQTPLHTHPDSDETMIVLEGEIVMHMDGVDHRVGRDGVAVATRGLPHAFMVTSPFARLLCLHTPGCCEAFYRDASDLAVDGEPDGVVDFDRVRSSAAHNGGIELLGPPPFTQS